MESMSSRASDEGTSAARKKLRLSNEQSAFLEEIKKHSTLNPVSILPKDSTFLIAASLYSIPTSFLVLTLTELAAAGGQKQKAALEKLLNLRPRQDPPRCTHEDARVHDEAEADRRTCA